MKRNSFCVFFSTVGLLQINLRLEEHLLHNSDIVDDSCKDVGVIRRCACGEYTEPIPVSGGCAVFEAMTGAAFAPIAVAGGVSIFACREERKTINAIDWLLLAQKLCDIQACGRQNMLCHYTTDDKQETKDLRCISLQNLNDRVK